MRRWTTVSLFSGVGGACVGLHAALDGAGIEHDHLAVDNWDVAVQTHQRNFPKSTSVCADLSQEAVNATTYGLTHIDLLWASPSCVHHSRARGDLDQDEGEREQVEWVVDRWIDAVPVDRLIAIAGFDLDRDTLSKDTYWGVLLSAALDVERGAHRLDQAIGQLSWAKGAIDTREGAVPFDKSEPQ